MPCYFSLGSVLTFLLFIPLIILFGAATFRSSPGLSQLHKWWKLSSIAHLSIYLCHHFSCPISYLIHVVGILRCVIPCSFFFNQSSPYSNTSLYSTLLIILYPSLFSYVLVSFQCIQISVLLSFFFFWSPSPTVLGSPGFLSFPIHLFMYNSLRHFLGLESLTFSWSPKWK